MRIEQGIFAALILAAMSGTSCSASAPAGGAHAPEKAAPDYCQMAHLALDAAVRTYEEQPLGLNLPCVNRVARTGGQVFVDARFSRDQHEPESAPECSDDRYVIRFDPRSFHPSPAQQVVLLLFSANSTGPWLFNAVVDSSDWPQRRPGTMSLSECGSAFGRLEQTDGGWRATVTMPPR